MAKSLHLVEGRYVVSFGVIVDLHRGYVDQRVDSHNRNEDSRTTVKDERYPLNEVNNDETE